MKPARHPLRRALLPVFTLALLLARLPAADSASLGFDAAVLAGFDRSVAEAIERRQISGAVTLIARRGEIAHLSVQGYADLETRRPMARDSIFRLASMTKPIASLALLLLCEDGRCHPNDPVSRYLPEFADAEVLTSQETIDGIRMVRSRPAKNPILLRHVLTHTAGHATQYGGTLGDLYLAIAKDQEKADLAEFCRRLARLPLQHEPGEGWIYGPSILVVSRLVEAISGQPFPEFLERRIFRPLGMKDTKFFLTEADASRFTTYYGPDGSGGLKVLDPGSKESPKVSGPKTFFSGSGGLHSTADDYLAFCQMVLRDGVHRGVRVASREIIALMKTDQIAPQLEASRLPGDDFATNGFTFGYQIKRRDAGPDPLPAGSLNWAGATGPRFFIDPADDVVAIFLVQLPLREPLKPREEFRTVVMRSLGRKIP
jgi:CubicO group peptidase (beta-lactamase class C family)